MGVWSSLMRAALVIVGPRLLYVDPGDLLQVPRHEIVAAVVGFAHDLRVRVVSPLRARPARPWLLGQRHPGVVRCRYSAGSKVRAMEFMQ